MPLLRPPPGGTQSISSTARSSTAPSAVNNASRQDMRGESDALCPNAVNLGGCSINPVPIVFLFSFFMGRRVEVEAPEEVQEGCRTPTAEEHRIPEEPTECPQPPRKKRVEPTQQSAPKGGYFASPELEDFFAATNKAC